MVMKTIAKKLGIFCLLLLLTASAAEAWVSNTVDRGVIVGQYTAIKIDSKNTTHISYYDSTNGDLKYAEWVGIGGNCGPGNTWYCGTVDSVGNIGLYTSLALDSSNTPHISYYDSTNGDLKYAEKIIGTGGNCGPGNSWKCETVDSTGITGLYTSIVLDSNNTPQISYYNASSGDLKYAKKVGTGGNCGPGNSWYCGTVDSVGIVGQYTSIALDSSNIPHISYYDASSGDLKYATKAYICEFDGCTWMWVPKTVDSLGTVGKYTSIELDSNNTPHISYYNASSGDLKYAKKVGTGGNCGPGNSWYCQTVDSTGDVGQYTSIALDSNNTPHISYYNASSSDLKYATKMKTCTFNICIWTWVPKTVDSLGTVGQYTSIGLDSSNAPHIAYYDSINGGLKYIKKTASGWVQQTVDLGKTGTYTSMAMDLNYGLHTSYYDNTNQDLKYAFQNYTGTWVKETIDSQGNVGQFTSIAVDLKNNSHISYYNTSSGDLKYAKRVGTGGNCGPGNSWYCETVDSVGNVGQYTSIALDSNNNPHISYYNASSGDLKYAKKTFLCVVPTPSATPTPTPMQIPLQPIQIESTCIPYWIYETVDSVGTVGQYTSIELDSNNTPHISYYNASSGDLKYAKRVGTGGNCGPGNSWRCEIVDSVGTVGQYTSIALDSNNTPHISYYNASSGDLKHAKKTARCVVGGACWMYETVDSVGTVGQYTSLKLYSSNTPYISYYDASNKDLKYAEMVGAGNGNCGPGNSWYCVTVDSTGDVGQYSSMVLAGSHINIHYYDATNGDLKDAFSLIIAN